MRFPSIWMLSFAIFLLAGCESSSNQAVSDRNRFDPTKSDPQAIRIADEIMVALGGRKNYEAIQYLSFRYDVLKLSFASGVGLTPENIYRVFIDPATRLIQRWEYLNQEGASPVPAWWEEWRSFDGVKLAALRVFENSNRKIRFVDLVVSREVDEKIFEMPETSRAQMF